MNHRKRKFGIELDAGIVEGPRGFSISKVLFKETLSNGNNVYSIFIENGEIIGEFIANQGKDGNEGKQGDAGRGIIEIVKLDKIDKTNNWEIKYTDKTSSFFSVEDGKDAYEIWLYLGNKGTMEDFLEFYRGFSISSIELKEEIPGIGNKYEVGIENGKKIGDFIAPIGPNGNVNFATFEIIDGYLYATYTRDTEHMKFAINKNGELEVTING